MFRWNQHYPRTPLASPVVPAAAAEVAVWSLRSQLSVG